MNDQKEHDDHSYAHDLQDKLKHISEVERGRKGYFCPGCRQKMIARKGDIKIHHFAHDPQDVERRGKCTYSDETIRHKLGKEILQHLKHVKVPSLRKYPPDGQNGGVQIIRESWTVEADSVAVEMPFYENDQGKIIWGRDHTWKTDSGKFLQIQPDITFLDAEGKPILLIELVATHKINEEKYLRIRNLGIDTIQVSLPTGPSTEIEETFHKTARTKWVYNYERENTEYQYVSPRSGQDLSLSDEFERGLVNIERTYECKVFEIKGAIRRFRRYLESEQFTSLRRQIQQKIRRTERNTTEYRKQWRELQERIDREVSAGFESERARLDEIEAKFILEESEFEKTNGGLEERYQFKDQSLRDEERTYRATSQDEIDDIAERIRELGANPEPLSDRIEKLRAEEEEYKRAIESEQIYLEERREFISEEISGIDKQSIEIESEASRLEIEYSGIEKRVRAENSEREDQIRSELGRSEQELRAKFDRDRELSVGAIKDRDIGRTPRLNRKIKEIVEAGGLLDIIPITAELERRLRKARSEFDQGSYKEWI
jgi:predicted  nucleic acid-binding Zn-ribbon protein